MASMPTIGLRLVTLVGESVREIGTKLVEQLIADISRAENRDKLDDVLMALFEDEQIEPEKSANSLRKPCLIFWSR